MTKTQEQYKCDLFDDLFVSKEYEELLILKKLFFVPVISDKDKKYINLTFDKILKEAEKQGYEKGIEDTARHENIQRTQSSLNWISLEKQAYENGRQEGAEQKAKEILGEISISNWFEDDDYDKRLNGFFKFKQKHLGKDKEVKK